MYASLLNQPNSLFGQFERLRRDLDDVFGVSGLPSSIRSVTLSRELDTTRIEANLKDGVLRLRIPKQAHAQHRRIAVTAD